jgi:hypothetical protein
VASGRRVQGMRLVQWGQKGPAAILVGGCKASRGGLCLGQSHRGPKALKWRRYVPEPYLPRLDQRSLYHRLPEISDGKKTSGGLWVELNGHPAPWTHYCRDTSETGCPWHQPCSLASREDMQLDPAHCNRAWNGTLDDESRWAVLIKRSAA